MDVILILKRILRTLVYCAMMISLYFIDFVLGRGLAMAFTKLICKCKCGLYRLVKKSLKALPPIPDNVSPNTATTCPLINGILTIIAAVFIVWYYTKNRRSKKRLEELKILKKTNKWENQKNLLQHILEENGRENSEDNNYVIPMYTNSLQERNQRRIVEECAAHVLSNFVKESSSVYRDEHYESNVCSNSIEEMVRVPSNEHCTIPDEESDRDGSDENCTIPILSNSLGENGQGESLKGSTIPAHLNSFEESEREGSDEDCTIPVHPYSFEESGREDTDEDCANCDFTNSSEHSISSLKPNGDKGERTEQEDEFQSPTKQIKEEYLLFPDYSNRYLYDVAEEDDCVVGICVE